MPGRGGVVGEAGGGPGRGGGVGAQLGGRCLPDFSFFFLIGGNFSPHVT